MTVREHDGSEQDRLRATVEHALALFWAAFEAEYREAKYGDMSWDGCDALEQAALRAGREWVERNVPGPERPGVYVAPRRGVPRE